jgi:hypothetical protein
MLLGLREIKPIERSTGAAGQNLQSGLENQQFVPAGYAALLFVETLMAPCSNKLHWWWPKAFRTTLYHHGPEYLKSSPPLRIFFVQTKLYQM